MKNIFALFALAILLLSCAKPGDLLYHQPYNNDVESVNVLGVNQSSLIQVVESGN